MKLIKYREDNATTSQLPSTADLCYAFSPNFTASVYNRCRYTRTIIFYEKPINIYARKQSYLEPIMNTGMIHNLQTISNKCFDIAQKESNNCCIPNKICCFANFIFWFTNKNVM